MTLELVSPILHWAPIESPPDIADPQCIARLVLKDGTSLAGCSTREHIHNGRIVLTAVTENRKFSTSCPLVVFNENGLHVSARLEL